MLLPKSIYLNNSGTQVNIVGLTKLRNGYYYSSQGGYYKIKTGAYSENLYDGFYDLDPYASLSISDHTPVTKNNTMAKKSTSKNTAAEQLGSEGGKKGGPARAKKLTSVERSKIASEAEKLNQKIIRKNDKNTVISIDYILLFFNNTT